MTGSTVTLSPIRVRELVGEFRALCTGIEWNVEHDRDGSPGQEANLRQRQLVRDTLRAGGHAQLVTRLNGERQARLSVRTCMADQMGAGDGSDGLDEALAALVWARKLVKGYLAQELGFA